MTGSTLSSFDALLKERYYDSGDFVEKLTFGENPLLGMLEKRGDSGMVGDVCPVPVITVLPQGVGGTFSVAQGNAKPSVSGKFAVETGNYFGVVQIGDKVLKSSKRNAGAFLENKMLEIDGLWETAGENLSIYLWGNGGGSLGRRASLSGNVIQLTENADASNFEVGMFIVGSANDGSDSTHSLRTNTSDPTVTAVDPGNGTVTLDNAALIQSFTDGDFLFRESDFFGDTGNIVLKGVQCFLTATNSPMALWGVSAATRATQPHRWAGCRVSDTELTGKSIEERMKLLIAQMTGRFKAKAPTAFFMHPEDMAKLDTLMGSRVQRDDSKNSTKFGYESITIATPSGKLPIYSDRHCPIGQAFALRMQNWWMTHLDDLLHPQNEDGFQMLRRDTSTDYEFRLISYPALINNAPLHNGRVSLYT